MRPYTKEEQELEDRVAKILAIAPQFVRSCGNCKNYHAIKEDYGECHAHPPVLVPYSGASVRGLWPPVQPTEWCGEFKGKEC